MTLLLICLVLSICPVSISEECTGHGNSWLCQLLISQWHVAEHLFICLLVICISSLVRCVFRLFIFLLLNFNYSLYILNKFYQISFILQLFYPSLFSHSLDIFLQSRDFNLTKSSLSLLSFMKKALDVLSEESLPHIRTSFSPMTEDLPLGGGHMVVYTDFVN